MTMDKRTLFRLTRESGFLWKSSGVLAVLLLAAGTAVSFLNTQRLNLFHEVMAAPQSPVDPEIQVGGLQPEALEPELILDAVLQSLETDTPFYARLMDVSYMLFFLKPETALELPAIGNLNADQQAIAQGLVDCYAGAGDEAGAEALKKLAEGDAPPDANFALAIVLMDRRDADAAVEALHREIDLHDSHHAREQIVETYLELEKYDILKALARDRKYREFFTPSVLQDLALARMDWPMILKTLLPAAYEHTAAGILVLAILSGLVWALILIRFNGSFSNVWKMVLPALVLGAFSAHATLLAVFWQDEQIGFRFGNTLYQQLLYCFSIGLREETIKLLFFVPLIPFLRRKDDLVLLTVAGLVGLGFALEENVNYFDASAGLSAVTRFATANFLHIALTAMCGLTLARAVYHRGEEIQHAATTFVIAVAIHGLYDAFLMVPALLTFSWLTYTVFVLMGYQYFGWLKHLRENWMDSFSITATFTYGIILVAGLTFSLYAWEVGPYLAVQAIIGEAIGTAIILVMFYREIPETVV